MSYDKDINGLTVKFKDEKSYLHCKIDYINYCEPLVAALYFLSFIQEERYNSDTCEVESIEPTQYTSEAPGAISNLIYFGSDRTATANPVDNSSPIGFASGNSYSGDTASVITSYGGFGAVDTNAFGTGDVHITGNLVVDGTITWENNSLSTSMQGIGTFTTPSAADPPDPPKEEPPEDPIDNRFDILDL